MRIKKIYQSIVPNGKLLNVKSNSKTDGYACDYINKLHTYSTEEKVVGTWIDGKPIYRRAFAGNTDSSGVVNLLSGDVDRYINSGGWINYAGDTDFPVSSTFGIDRTNEVRLIKIDRNFFALQYGSGMFNKPYQVWVEYTKLTDVATI